MALDRGTRLGVYEVTASIGEGGMGQVYRTTDTVLGREVASRIVPRAGDVRCSSFDEDLNEAARKAVRPARRPSADV